MDFDLNCVRSVPGDLTVELCRPRADDALQAAATGSPGDAREVYITSHGSTNNNQFSRVVQLARRFMSLVLEQRDEFSFEQKPLIR